MNKLLIKKLNGTNPEAAHLSAMLDEGKVPYHHIACAGWSEYPYKPEVKFRIAHNGSGILLSYRVDEADIKAACKDTNGKVWEDSCVEFFISFEGADYYYNIEANCIGTILVATGVDKHHRKPVSDSIISLINRWSSLGSQPIESRSGKWELSLIIPADVFYLSGVNTFDGLHAKGNFYKCGDNLHVPHFLSWNLVENEKPDFHLPQFFGELFFDY
jgi:hypothetical protein